MAIIWHTACIVSPQEVTMTNINGQEKAFADAFGLEIVCYLCGLEMDWADEMKFVAGRLLCKKCAATQKGNSDED